MASWTGKTGKARAKACRGVLLPPLRVPLRPLLAVGRLSRVLLPPSLVPLPPLLAAGQLPHQRITLANASDAFSVKPSDFARSSSFFVAPVSDTESSFVAVGCEVLSLGAGRVVDNEEEVFFLVTSAPEGVVVAADLEAVRPGTFPDR